PVLDRAPGIHPLHFDPHFGHVRLHDALEADHRRAADGGGDRGMDDRRHGSGPAQCSSTSHSTGMSRSSDERTEQYFSTDNCTARSAFSRSRPWAVMWKRRSTWDKRRGIVSTRVPTTSTRSAWMGVRRLARMSITSTDAQPASEESIVSTGPGAVMPSPSIGS